MSILTNPRVLRRTTAIAAAAALAISVGAATADAATARPDDGTPGWYELCSYGTYSSQVNEAPVGDEPGWTTVIVAPGHCTPLYMSGNQAADIYGFYPGGTAFLVGVEWWPANIATTGNEGDWGWYVF
jgi:hypothetical protein